MTCVSTETAAQVGCVNPMEISELRVLKSKKCVNIDGTDGRGKMNTNLCDGYHDQQIIMCKDGTIRNLKAPHYCFTPGKDGKGNLRSTSCEVYPAIPDYQKWRYGRSKTFVDTGGIKQEAREIINVKSGACMDVNGRGGNGKFLAYRCENLDDQYFYFRSRGKLLGHGRLQVQKSGLCLDVSGDQGRGIVQINKCEDAADQHFDFHENGELVNKKSGLCVNIGGYSGYGGISMYACEDLPDQMWTRPRQYCVGDYCSFRSKKAAQCIDERVRASCVSSLVSIMIGCNVATHKCQGAPVQLFRWLKGNWVTPSAAWTMIGCNENGKVTHAISNTISYKTKITTSISLSVSSTIEAGVIFGGASTTIKVTASLAKEWENSKSGTRKTTSTCENYDTGKPFIRGCMWQFRLTTREATKNDILTWSPKIVKCTSNTREPKCLPFMRCKDDACTLCGKMPGARKKKSVDESLTWKKVLKID